MSFTATPTDGSPSPIPMSSAVPDGTNTPLAVEGGPSKSTGGNNLVPVAVYHYDGYDVCEGVTTDAAVTGDNTGTVSAKLRGMVKILTDIWDNVNHRIHVNVDNANANGQATMANSAPVTLASNQTPLTSGTGTKTNVSSSASSTSLLASNANRKGAMFYNDSTQILYLDLSGGTASNSSYSLQVGAQQLFELPPQPVYTGAITGIWAAANGNLRCTEFS